MVNLWGTSGIFLRRGNENEDVSPAFAPDTDVDKAGVDVVGTVDASDWLQTDAR